MGKRFDRTPTSKRLAMLKTFLATRDMGVVCKDCQVHHATAGRYRVLDKWDDCAEQADASLRKMAAEQDAKNRMADLDVIAMAKRLMVQTLRKKKALPWSTSEFARLCELEAALAAGEGGANGVSNPQGDAIGEALTKIFARLGITGLFAVAGSGDGNGRGHTN